MSVETFLDGRVTLHGGDCLDVLKTLPDASVDSVVTDPPYHLTSIVKRFGAKNAAPAKTKQTGAFARSSKGFMGKTWDGGDIAFRVELWEEVLRVLKPGGHLVAFSGTRTYHRMAVAIEDAGFEIRDQLAWTYGSGFPKSHDVSKAIDKAKGVEREVVGSETLSNDIRGGALLDAAHGTVRPALVRDITVATSPEAKAWNGWGSALKPAWEPICLARKALDGTIAENVLKHGVGGLNIDGCRIEGDISEMEGRSGKPTPNKVCEGIGRNQAGIWSPDQRGRFPANLIHDGSPEVLAAFPAETRAGERPAHRSGIGFHGGADGTKGERVVLDKGSAARFFYTAKADADDRIGSKHPTVKPVDLMQWLVRLVTPKGGTVLDLFAGTGTTGEAAFREGGRAILIEREDEYRADIARRMALAVAGPAARRSTIARLKGGADEGFGPLFSSPEAAE